MTLGIAAIEDSDVLVMADTQLSFPENSGKKPMFGLKVFFLDQNTAIAYAGVGGEEAHARLAGIYEQGHRGDLRILAEQIRCSFDQEVDFLLARTGAMPSIAKIANNRVAIRSDQGIYWIGDADAAHYVSLSGAHDLYQLQERLSSAIGDPHFPTVGGHCVVARGTTEGFRFVPYMKLVSPMCPQHPPERTGWETVDFGTAATGGFGYTTVVPKQAGVNGWGVFYFQGSFGQYWHVDLNAKAYEVVTKYAKNVTGFVKLIQDDTGVELEFCGSLG